MSDLQVQVAARFWALDRASRCCDSLAEANDVAALVRVAEPLADWLLGHRRAVEAFPREGEKVADIVPAEPHGVERERLRAGLTLGTGDSMDDTEQRGLAAAHVGDVDGHETDSVAGVDNRNVAAGPGAVMAPGLDGGA